MNRSVVRIFLISKAIYFSPVCARGTGSLSQLLYNVSGGFRQKESDPRLFFHKGVSNKDCGVSYNH